MKIQYWLYKIGVETELHTDASSQGFGAILLQKDNGDQKFHLVYYASWKTTDAESRYTSYKLEVLAIIKSLSEFRVYLLGISFKIVTDCQAFSLTMKKKNLWVRVARWALLLEEFDYAIEYRPGRAMRHVDALSRNPLQVMLVEDDSNGLLARIAIAQHEDDDLKWLFEAVTANVCADFVLQHMLYKKYNDDLLSVILRGMQRDIIKQIHDKGHFAVRKVEQILRKEYWFSRMREKIEKVIRNCVACILADRKHGKQEGFLRPLPKGNAPLEVFHIDYLGPIPSTKKSYAHLLDVVDSFTKFTWLYPTKSTTAEEAITRLKKQAVLFGNPRRIIPDRGAAFTSHAFRDYCLNENVEHVLVTAGVPRLNGQVERINRIVIPILTKLTALNPRDWCK